MPRRDDIGSVLVIGSGPIQIGQACEFDYSGTQACRALRAEGYRVILVNSNPATIMTDPEFADRTYLEPLTAEVLTKIVERERPDAVLPTLGGQTALNLTMELSRAGVLERCRITVLGADPETIQIAERRDEFRTAMHEIGLEVPDAVKADSVEQARAAAERIGYPVMVRPSYILGGSGTGVAHDVAELERIVANALHTSPVHEVLVEQSIAGWKEYELEVMRDRADNCVVVCSIENVDPVGVHTGDSITVAPAQTLSDVEYQRMRDAAFACIRRVGVETGGSNVQFAVHPADGRMVIIEMNPRVSRSSALASKATGFPIAKIATLLAVGYTLDEIRNDITRETPACFEPALDYVVTKVPRWGFEKFGGVPDELGTKMQSIGEAMAIGRTFPESLQKCLRSLETGRLGLNCDPAEERAGSLSDEQLRAELAVPTPDRVFGLELALRRGFDADEVVRLSGVDPWFVAQIARIAAAREELAKLGGADRLSPAQWRRYRRLGFCDAQLAWLWREPEEAVRRARTGAGVRTTFKSVDTCAAEFAAVTPYFYATTEDSEDLGATGKPTVVILGSGPNRIGQGVEFDYCCVQASLALREAGYETVIINCNPETVSTDYDVSDRLYFEPLTPEDVRAIVESERDRGELVGVIAALGGQTAVNLAAALPPEWLLGTGPDAIARAEDRDRWAELCRDLDIPQPEGETAESIEEAREVARRIGFPLLLRPSFVLSGRGMQIITDEARLDEALAALAEADDGRPAVAPGRPLLLDRFVRDAVELDVDLLRDRTGEVLVGAIMEHIEQAGVHSGDSACVIPPQTLSESTLDTVRAHSEALAGRLGVEGLLNIQFGVGPDGEVFVIEANPRASRTVPFASKAVGVPLARLAARIAVGATLAELRREGLPATPDPAGHVFVKEVVLPFDHFPDTTDHLGPEMRSTGEVLGMGRDLAAAYAKSQSAAGHALRTGRAWLTGRSPGDGRIRRLAQRFRHHEFEVRTPGDAAAAADRVAEQEVDVLVHLNDSPHQGLDDASRTLRTTALRNGVPYITTDRAAALAAAAAGAGAPDVVSIQELHPS